MIEERESFYVKAKNFFILNWWTLWIVVVGASTISVYLNTKTNNRIDVVADLLEKNSKGVVMLTYAGTPVYAEKEIINIQDEEFKKSLRAILQKYLIIDASRLTNDYADIPASVEDIYNKNEDLSDFNTYYLKAKEDKQAFNYMKEHLRTLLSLLKEANLPENIVLLKSRMDSYEIVNNSFTTVIYADVLLDYFLPEFNQWKRSKGGIRIDATGIFDSTKGDALNPLGIKINTFKVTYPKKREK